MGTRRNAPFLRSGQIFDRPCWPRLALESVHRFRRALFCQPICFRTPAKLPTLLVATLCALALYSYFPTVCWSPWGMSIGQTQVVASSQGPETSSPSLSFIGREAVPWAWSKAEPLLLLLLGSTLFSIAWGIKRWFLRIPLVGAGLSRGDVRTPRTTSLGYHRVLSDQRNDLPVVDNWIG